MSDPLAHLREDNQVAVNRRDLLAALLYIDGDDTYASLSAEVLDRLYEAAKSEGITQ